MNRTLVIILACLAIVLYMRSPIDLLPDTMGPIGLLDDLLVALAIVWWLRRRLRLPPRPRTTARQRARGAGFAAGSARDGADDASHDWDPYSVLGVAHGASADEISRAY